MREDVFSERLGESRRNLFPSVLLQPLGHLSVSLESTTCKRSVRFIAHVGDILARPRNTFTMNGLQPTKNVRHPRLCKTSKCSGITYGDNKRRQVRTRNA